MNIIIPLQLFIMIILLALIGVTHAVYYAADEDISTLSGKIRNIISGLIVPCAYVLTLYFAVMLNI